MVAAVRAFGQLDRIDRSLVLEALILLGLVRASVAVLRFTTLRRGIAAYVARGSGAGWRSQVSPGSRGLPGSQDSRGSPKRVAWAVNAVARRLPVRTSCLIDAVVADAMLRRRGFDPTFRVGVRQPDRRPLDGHAWVECEGEVVVGGLDELGAYTILTRRS
jgi:hypothetical protein